MQQLSPNNFLHGGTYKIEWTLGQGSFGITYLATHVALNKKVAIKEFFMKDLNGRSEDGSITGMSDGSLSMDYARKFRKEALNLADLDHPNIVRVTDSFKDNGTVRHVFFVAETKGSLDGMELRGVEKAKTDCAKKLFNRISTSKVRYGVVDKFENLYDIINGIE